MSANPTGYVSVAGSEPVHSQVDYNTTFKGFGVVEAGLNFVPVAYHPRKLGANDVEIEIEYASICGSDIHTATGGWGPLKHLPLIVGHEMVGRVTQRGENSKWKVGDYLGVGCVVQACLHKGAEQQCHPCHIGRDNHCNHAVLTYNSEYPDGVRSQGGYCDHIRLDSELAFAVPKELPAKYAVSYFCAGVTTFAPLKRFGAGPGKRVGIIGLGGLGHYAVKFAKAMGAEVYVISTSASKRDEAIRFGAVDLINSKDPEQFAKYANSFDLLLNTSNAHQLDAYLSLAAKFSTYVSIGAPEVPLEYNVFQPLIKDVTLATSLIGSAQDVRDCLEFGAKHNILPDIEEFPLTEVNAAIQKVNTNAIRYRAVLKNESYSQQ